MTTADLATVVETLDAALRDGRPEDVLGTDDPSREWRRLARRIHPDANGGAPEATAAFRKLDEVWRLAVTLRDAGIYGRERAPTVRVTTKTRTYEILGRVRADFVADHFQARWGGVVGHARVVRKPQDNHLMRNEAGLLKFLAAKPPTQDMKMFLPTLVESVGIRQSHGVVRQTNIFENPDGDWYTLADVIARYPRGVDPRDMAWMWRRLLAVLGAAHESDVIHGAVLPENVLIEPTLHGLILANWSCGVMRGGAVPAVSTANRGWYPPEVLTKQPGFGSDIYLGARTMLALCGSPHFMIPRVWPRTLRAFFRGCLLDNPKRRPSDALALLADFDAVLERTYGPRRFRPFTMKGGTS